MLKRKEWHWIFQWIDSANIYNVSGKPTEWSDSLGELGDWKLHPIDNDSIPWFGIDPLHYVSSRSDFSFEFSEIFVIEKRLPNSPSRGVDEIAYL
jgi:hypothetical protein